MTKKIYYLSSCSTCKRVMHDLKIGNKFELRDIKESPITEDELEHLKKLTGSYEKIFSKIAMKYRIWGLNNMTLTEDDFRSYILKEYTFIKRPVIIIDDKVFIGSSRPVLTAAKEALLALEQ